MNRAAFVLASVAAAQDDTHWYGAVTPEECVGCNEFSIRPFDRDPEQSSVLATQDPPIIGLPQTLVNELEAKAEKPLIHHEEPSSLDEFGFVAPEILIMETQPDPTTYSTGFIEPPLLTTEPIDTLPETVLIAEPTDTGFNAPSPDYSTGFRPKYSNGFIDPEAILRANPTYTREQIQAVIENSEDGPLFVLGNQILKRKQRYEYAACKLEGNPAIAKTSDVYGVVILAQNPKGGPVWMRADLEGLPDQVDYYDLAINEGRWDGNNCASSGEIWVPTSTGETHYEGGDHVGELLELMSDLGGAIQFFTQTDGPMLSGQVDSVIGRTVAIYEDSGPFHAHDPSRLIACCTIEEIDSLERWLKQNEV